MTRSYLPLDVVKAAKPAMARRGVSVQARGPEGFLTAYERARGQRKRLGRHKSGQPWTQRREAFLARHLAQMTGDGWEKGPKGPRPTRRHLALVAWAYSPTPDRLRRWLQEGGHG